MHRIAAPGHVESSQTRDRTASSALTGGFLPTVPPGKSSLLLNKGFHSVSELGFFSFYQRFSEVSDLTLKIRVL